MSTMVRASELTVGTEFVIHAAAAREFADLYLTLDRVERDADGVTLYVTDRRRDEHVLVVESDLACTLYGPPTQGFPPIHTSVLETIVNGGAS